MTTQLLDNRLKTVLDFFREQATDSLSMGIAVAFVKQSGWRLIERAVLDVLAREGQLEIIFGLDFHFTEPEVIRKLVELGNRHPDSVFCQAFSDFATALPDTPNFHPKLYILEKPGNKLAMSIGSSNLTQGGLQENVELNIGVVTSKRTSLARQVSAFFRRIQERETTFTPNLEFLEGYSDIYSILRRRGRQAERDLGVQRQVRRLKRQAVQLQRATITQLQIVTEAVSELTQNQPYARLSDIQRLAQRRAQELGIQYDWATFDNSVRGRLNANVVGKPTGREIFERPPGRPGTGRYRLRR